MLKSSKVVLKSGYIAEGADKLVTVSRWLVDRHVPVRSWDLEHPLSKLSIYKEDTGIIKVVLENGTSAFVCPASGVFSAFFSPSQFRDDKWGQIEPYFMQYVTNGGALDRMIFQVPNHLREPLRNFIQSGTFGSRTDAKADCLHFMRELRDMLSEFIEGVK